MTTKNKKQLLWITLLSLSSLLVAFSETILASSPENLVSTIPVIVETFEPSPYQLNKEECYSIFGPSRKETFASNGVFYDRHSKKKTKKQEWHFKIGERKNGIENI